jgi:hypothetical protein
MCLLYIGIPQKSGTAKKKKDKTTNSCNRTKPAKYSANTIILPPSSKLILQFKKTCAKQQK